MANTNKNKLFWMRVYFTIMSPIGYLFQFDDPIDHEHSDFISYMKWILKEIWTNPDIEDIIKNRRNK